MGFKVCPGSSSFAQPTPESVACPDCGAEVEIWSDEATGECPACKKAVIRQATQSCIDWCRYAQQCLGDEKFRQYGDMRAAMKKPALLDAVSEQVGPDSVDAQLARKVVAYAETLLPGQKTADPNVVIAAAAVSVLARDKNAEAPADARDRIRAILSGLDYPEPFIVEVCAIVQQEAGDAAAGGLNGRVVADAWLLATSEVRRKRARPGELSQAFLDQFQTEEARRLAVEMRQFMAGG